MKIRDAKGRSDGNSGYARVMGNEELGKLISKIQATVISNGSELERIITNLSNCISNLDTFLYDNASGNQKDGVYLCKKSILKKSKFAVKNIEPDLLIFIVQKNQVCKVIELKDGDAFDTKKSQGEKEHLEEFAKEFAIKVAFRVEYYICCFNQDDKNKIYDGFKKSFDMEHILTGRELCSILKIDYDRIINKRKEDSTDNFTYFISELLNIKEVRDAIKLKL